MSWKVWEDLHERCGNTQHLPQSDPWLRGGKLSTDERNKHCKLHLGKPETYSMLYEKIIRIWPSCSEQVASCSMIMPCTCSENTIARSGDGATLSPCVHPISWRSRPKSLERLPRRTSSSGWAVPVVLLISCMLHSPRASCVLDEVWSLEGYAWAFAACMKIYSYTVHVIHIMYVCAKYME